MQDIVFNNGLKIPAVGFGTMNIFDLKECIRVIKEAYDVGYRLFDCAQIYGNEEILGQALKEAKISRKEIFLTTKVWISEFEGNRCRESLEESMRKLKTNYLDFVLIHWPYGNTYHAWRELEKMYEEGTIRGIGVSNYQASQLADLIHFHKIVPIMNQIKVTLRCQGHELYDMMKKNGIIMQGYQVFGKEEMQIVYNGKMINDIANKYHKTTRQIVLKYFIQKNISVITRPMEKEHMIENIDIFDFLLTDEELKSIEKLDMLEYNTTPSQDYKRTLSILDKEEKLFL